MATHQELYDSLKTTHHEMKRRHDILLQNMRVELNALRSSNIELLDSIVKCRQNAAKVRQELDKLQTRVGGST